MSHKSILLKGGTVLTHGLDDHVHPIQADVLIEGNIITKIERDIDSLADAEVIDCVDKILCPGFIDTHHHVWQTLLKGRHANDMLLDYFPSGNFTSALHSPTDVFWGQLGGALECLDAGTITVVDFAHINYSPEHTKAAIAATISSGLRSVFCYCPTPRVATWKPFAPAQDMLADWIIDTLESLASQSPFAEGRINLGFAFDGLFLPKEVVISLFEKVKGLGIKVITLHSGRNGIQGYTSELELLHSYGLLDSSILFAHFTNPTSSDSALLVAHNSHCSSTPSTELQMGLGFPVAFNSDIQSHSSLGIDCHSNNNASIVSEMRILLQASRGKHNDQFVEAGLVSKTVNKTAEEAFNLGTIGGARAIGMEDKIGSLAVGKMADVVIFDALSPGMVCASQHDPLAAVVLHSSPADIEAVIVDGVIRKKAQVLEPVDLKAGSEIWGDENIKGEVEWKAIAKELVNRRAVMQTKIEKLDIDEVVTGVVKMWHIDASKIVESI